MAIFRGLGPEEFDALVASVDPRPVGFEKGQIIFREGEPATNFFVIAQGSVRVEIPVSGSRPRAIRLDRARPVP